MRVVRSRAEFREARAQLDGRVGLVPTMGALHAGHLALLAQARAGSDNVIATIFVNPAQFAAGEDLDRYPRTLDADLTLCRDAGTELVWVPQVADVYPAGTAGVAIVPGPLGDELEGATRPGHFRGVLTVVAKFCLLTRAGLLYLGEKDYQQLVLVSAMVGDLDLGVDVVGVATVRDDDGLAMSSRNRFLDPAARHSATALVRALRAGRDAADRSPAGILAAAGAVFAPDGPSVDYLELRSPELGRICRPGAARLLVAARVGGTRLIDNMEVEVDQL